MASETPENDLMPGPSILHHQGFVAPLNVIAFFCTDGKGKWLLHRRGPACSDEMGKWDFGGGKLEHGESRFECLKRELREEYGPNLRCLLTQQLPGFTMFRQPLGGTQHLEVTPFVCLIDPATVEVSGMIESGKTTGFRWLEVIRTNGPGEMIPELLDSELHSAIPFVLERYGREFVGALNMGTIFRGGADPWHGGPYPDALAVETIRTLAYVVVEGPK